MPSYKDVILATPGLQTYHRMSGGASEASIGPDTALMTHTGSPPTVAGLIRDSNGAKAYDASTRQSTFSTSSLAGSALSIECWFQETTLADWSYVFGNDNDPTSRFNILRRAAESNLIANWMDTGPTYFDCIGPYTPFRLTHVAATLGSNTLRLYVNGKQVASTTVTGSMPAGSRPFRVARAGAQSVIGAIDECATYNVTLTAGQVAQHYKAGLASGVLAGLLLPV